MTQDTNERPVDALLQRLAGGPTPGHVGLVVAGPGVGKTALAVHVSLSALLDERRVLHVALTDTVTRVRAWYDELLRATRGASDDHTAQLVALERRRMVLSYAGRDFDVAHVGAQAKLFAEVAEFDADLIVIDGMSADDFETHRRAVADLSADLGKPVWVTVSSLQPIATGDDVAFGLRLENSGGAMRLHLREGDSFRELPWQLDVHTHLLGMAADAVPAGPPPSADCTLFSGGAAGSEAAFGEAAERYGVREVHFTFDGHKQSRAVGSQLLSPRELEAGDVSLVYVSRRLNRTFNEHGLVRKVLQTLWHMVSRSQQVFVVGTIQEDGTVVGGTGWSVELARMWAKDLWVFDQVRDGWYRWDGSTWTAGNAEIRTGSFCGTGTRYLDDNGRAAVDDLFARAFGG
jgi:hypothetical protein